MNKEKDRNFYIANAPMKITEARKLKLHSECWSLLTEYYLESVKISNYNGKILSTATLKVADRSGLVICVIKGPSVGLLFGLTVEEWVKVEGMCNLKDQLFYRFFKNGMNSSFSFEQQLFYNFCRNNQHHDVLVARFRRCVNTRNKFKSDAVVEIVQLTKCETGLLDLYIDRLRINTNNVPQNNYSEN